MDCGPPPHNRATKASRVSSPSAEKIGPACARPVIPPLCGDISLDSLELLGPALVVHAERLGAPRRRDAVEARLGDGELVAARNFLEPELDNGLRLARQVHSRVHGVRLTPVRE